MKDMRQIKILENSIKCEKKKYLSELSKINSKINTKQSLIKKMQSYQFDYLNSNNFNLSKSMPGLHGNMRMFIKKIDNVINHTESEIIMLEKMKLSLLDTIGNLDKKLNLMLSFEEKLNADSALKELRSEQLMIDSIAATRNKRREHE